MRSSSRGSHDHAHRRSDPTAPSDLPTPDRAPEPPRRCARGTCSGIAGLDADEITLILDTAEAMKEIGGRAIKKVPTLRGRTVVNLFFEPSTRTRTSFEIAEKRLSADTLSIADRDVERDQGRDARRHRAQPRGDVARHDRDAARLVRRAGPARAHLPLGDHQRRRRHARASDAGAARRVHHPRAQGPARRASRSRSSATCCTAASCARTSCCSRPWAPTSGPAARRR